MQPTPLTASRPATEGWWAVSRHHLRDLRFFFEIRLFIEWKVIQKFNRDEEVQRRTYVHPGILHIY